ncbi:MAG TPA: dihydroneopterin aldolase [Firmicutes bacterium]|nr:dihydroneopterin aldolase [Bacillota bacterium]
MGKIMLNDMEFVTKHGACPHEYEIDQKFKVDVLMYSDCVLAAGATDDLLLTVHYGEAYEMIADIMYGEHVELIETLAFRIGQQLIESYEELDKVKVEVRKMNPPIPGFTGSAAVELTVKR